MPSISSLVANLIQDYPSIRFTAGSDFLWNPTDQTVFYVKDAPDGADLLLHETAHALLGHATFTRDIELLKIERQAWQYAEEHLAPHYGIVLDEAAAEAALDTYREWIHRRSLCPQCQLNGIQESRDHYRCVHCHQRWRVNQARNCRLKRTCLYK